MRRLIGAGLGVAAMLLAGVVPTPTARAQDQVTMIIGLTQPWETLNPVVGFAVPEYEFWNVQYAGLVSRAAADFAARARARRVVGGGRARPEATRTPSARASPGPTVRRSRPRTSRGT